MLWPSRNRQHAIAPGRQCRHVGPKCRLLDVGHERSDHLRGALDHCYPGSVALDTRLGAFARRIEGSEAEAFGQRSEMMCVVRRQDGEVERVLAGRIRGDGSIGEQIVFAERREGHKLPDAELVERERASFVRAEDLHAGGLLNGREACDERAAFGQVLRAQRLCQRKGRGERDGHRGDQHDQREGQRREQRDVDERGEGQHGQDKQDINNDEVSDDLHDDGFQVRDGARRFDQFGGLAKGGLCAGGDDGAGRLALPGNRAGVQGLTPCIGYLAHPFKNKLL